MNFVTSLPNYRKHPIALPAGESPLPLLAYVWGLSKLDQPVDGLVSFPSATCYGGILDSPLVIHHTASNHGHHSHFPMQPMLTLALPPIDTLHNIAHAVSSSSSCLLPFFLPPRLQRTNTRNLHIHADVPDASTHTTAQLLSLNLPSRSSLCAFPKAQQTIGCI